MRKHKSILSRSRQLSEEFKVWIMEVLPRWMRSVVMLLFVLLIYVVVCVMMMCVGVVAC